MMLYLFRIILITVVIAACVYMNLRCMMKLDKEHGMQFTLKEWGILAVGSFVSAGIWSIMSAGESAASAAAWILIHIYFLSCSLTDTMTCQVYDIFQYPGITAAVFLVLGKTEGVEVGISIIIFALLQYCIFMKLYGEADGMGLLIAALAEGSLGYDINMYLFHMIAAYLLLGVVQAFRGNIAVRGKLKKPVPFMPYITVSFWMILMWGTQINISFYV